MRYHKLDEIRGITLISMILYHGCWDMVYILGYDWQWYHSTAAYWWQQSIAWTFILLSGFCWQLGKRRLRRGLTVLGAGVLVTAATIILMPQSRIVFGVLTLMGSCMLLMIPVDWAFRKLSQQWERYYGKSSGARIGAGVGLTISACLFIVTRNVNEGWLGFERLNIIKLPESWYCNSFTTYLGFMQPGFFSTDYFSLIPWFFLFLCGYFLFSLLVKRDANWEEKRLGKARSQALKGASPIASSYHKRHPLHEKSMAPIRWMGRHSLLVYLLHQPVLYGFVMMLR